MGKIGQESGITPLFQMRTAYLPRKSAHEILTWARKPNFDIRVAISSMKLAIRLGSGN